MIGEIQNLLDKYSSWLEDNTSLREVGDFVEITTPHLDRHNDCIQIYIKRCEDGFILTDDGYTLDDLEASGCKISSSKRQALFEMTLNGFGVQCNTEAALEIKASKDNFSPKKHNLVQAMLAVNDLFYLASPTITSLFYEDVMKWLDSSNIRYTHDVKIPGKSGFDHKFDFIIPKSKKKPERVVHTINQPNSSKTKMAIFAWTDTKEVRSSSRIYVMLNDADKPVSEDVQSACRKYDMNPVLYSRREEKKGELAA